MNFKRILSTVIVVTFLGGSLVACGSLAAPKQSAKKNIWHRIRNNYAMKNHNHHLIDHYVKKYQSNTAHIENICFVKDHSFERYLCLQTHYKLSYYDNTQITKMMQ